MATKSKRKPVARKPRPAAHRATASKSRPGKAAKLKRRVPPRAPAAARVKTKRPQPKSHGRTVLAKPKPTRKRIAVAKPARGSAAPPRPVKIHAAPKRPPLRLVPKPPANNNAVKGAIVKEKPAKEPLLKIKQQAPAPKPREAAPRPAPIPLKPAPAPLAPEPSSTFAEGDFVVYPTHGVGRVVAIETQEIAGISLPLIVINFDKDRMTLRVPVAKAHNSGLRKLSSRKVMDTALATLKGRSRSKRTMWSRRAQEYEAKINSGDPVSIAEVVRDLHRGADQPDQSYSERQIYQAALDRLARELAAVERIDERAAAQRLEDVLKAA